MSKVLGRIGKILYRPYLPIVRRIVKDSHRARVLAVHDGKVLLVEHTLGDGGWTLPGGGTQRGEDTRSAAARELREETRLTIDAGLLQPLGRGGHTGDGLIYTYECFLLTLDELPAIRPSFEVCDFCWVEPAQAVKLKLSEEARFAVEALLKQ